MNEKRPWGGFQVIHEEENVKVKILDVLPGKRLSYQSHEHRMERWVVVEGEAEVTVGDKVFMMTVGEIVRIGFGEKHRLSNPSSKMLRIVEVQIGDYLGEDDIIRYEDDFGRSDE